jgi:hypothetical protein
MKLQIPAEAKETSLSRSDHFILSPPNNEYIRAIQRVPINMTLSADYNPNRRVHSTNKAHPQR